MGTMDGESVIEKERYKKPLLSIQFLSSSSTMKYLYSQMTVVTTQNRVAPFLQDVLKTRPLQKGRHIVP